MKSYTIALLLLVILFLGVISKSKASDKYLFIKKEILSTEKGVSKKDTSFTIVISEDSKFITIRNFNSSDTYVITKRTVSYSVEDYTVYDKYENNSGFCLILNKSPDYSFIIMVKLLINNNTYYYDF